MSAPEEKDKIPEEVKQKWIKVLDYIQSEAEKRGKKFIVGDDVRMAAKDVLLYFSVRARGEAIRMLYFLAGKEFEDKRIEFSEWSDIKPSIPLGQIPTLTTSEGTLCQSNVIARHVARKLGMVGKTQWEETIHDLVVECAQESANFYVLEKGVPKWLIFKSEPVPENKDQILEDVKQKWIKVLDFIKMQAEKRGKKFIVGDEIGLADVWLWCMMDFCRAGCPDIMTMTPWTKQWSAKFEADPKMKKYLQSRPNTL